METLLTQKELAARWGISERWVEKLRARGTGPAFLKLGDSPTLKTIRYRLADIEAYEEERRTKGGQ